MPAAPEHIHPALWRGSQMIPRAGRCAPVGHPALAAELPGGGWPLGSLVELLLPRPGIGEIRLLQPALAGLDAAGPVALLQPPHLPHVACWTHWRLDPARLLWLQPAQSGDALWAAEQVLRSGSCAALLYWAGRLRHASLRRLHLAAQCGPTLFFLLRPDSEAALPSPAPLRLALAPAPAGVAVSIVKRRGPALAAPLFVPLDDGHPTNVPLHAPAKVPVRYPDAPLPAPTASTPLSGTPPHTCPPDADPSAEPPSPHAPVDRPAPSPAQPGRLAPALAG